MGINLENQREALKENESVKKARSFFGQRKAKVITTIIIVLIVLAIAYFGTHLRHYVNLKTMGKTEIVEHNDKYVIKAKDYSVHIEFEDGDTYDGEFEDGKFEGKGKLIYENGDVYEGEFEDGEKSGKGTYTWKDGDKYEGEWMKDSMSGQGKYYFAAYEYLTGYFSKNEPSSDLKYTKNDKTINVEYENGSYYEK